MLLEKRPLSINEIEAQTALLLPERETPTLVTIGCVGVCVGKIHIKVQDVNVAAQVCAQVQALNVQLLNIFPDQNQVLTCQVKQQ
jgi:hypothetical protein